MFNYVLINEKKMFTLYLVILRGSSKQNLIKKPIFTYQEIKRQKENLELYEIGDYPSYKVRFY